MPDVFRQTGAGTTHKPTPIFLHRTKDCNKYDILDRNTKDVLYDEDQTKPVDIRKCHEA